MSGVAVEPSLHLSAPLVHVAHSKTGLNETQEKNKQNKIKKKSYLPTKNPPVTCSLSPLTSIFRKRRPRRSVWSVPHRLGTLTTHCLCTFMSHAGQKERKIALKTWNTFFPYIYSWGFVFSCMTTTGIIRSGGPHKRMWQTTFGPRAMSLTCVILSLE